MILGPISRLGWVVFPDNTQAFRGLRWSLMGWCSYLEAILSSFSPSNGTTSTPSRKPIRLSRSCPLPCSDRWLPARHFSLYSACLPLTSFAIGPINWRFFLLTNEMCCNWLYCSCLFLCVRRNTGAFIEQKESRFSWFLEKMEAVCCQAIIC